jgi:hypothetical protein
MGNENVKCDMDVVSVWSGKEDRWMDGWMDSMVGWDVSKIWWTDGRTNGGRKEWSIEVWISGRVENLIERK